MNPGPGWLATLPAGTGLDPKRGPESWNSFVLLVFSCISAGIGYGIWDILIFNLLNEWISGAWRRSEASAGARPWIFFIF